MSNGTKVLLTIGGVAVVVAGASITAGLKLQKKLKDVLEDKKVIYIENDKRRKMFDELNILADTDNKVGMILNHVNEGVKTIKHQNDGEDLIYKFKGFVENRKDKTRMNGTEILIGDPKSQEEKEKERKEREKEMKEQARMDNIANAVREGFSNKDTDTEQ